MRHYSRESRDLARLIYFCAVFPLLVYGWIRFLSRPREWWEILGMALFTLLCLVGR
jgi:hypothetical protein